ncbi:MAG: family 1 glycosylhydrolase, partial [Myxococcota bacterium]
VVVQKLGDRVKHWMTLNEPQVIVNKGYVEGSFAPGERQDRASAINGAHNLLRAHGRAVQAIRAEAKSDVQVGWAPVCLTRTPTNPDAPEEVSLARKAMFSADMGVGQWTLWNNTWWMDPVFLGEYPSDGLLMLGADGPNVLPGDMELISQPIDFIGTNIYHAEQIRSNDSGGVHVVPRIPGHAQTRMHWMVTPDALYWGPRFLYERYQKPIVITENGMSCHDWVSVDGQVHDPQRIDFITRYTVELRRAVNEGVPVWGYLYWSALDNFEWERGYTQRFGLIYVDYINQKRILKDSAHWYRQVIESNGANLPDKISPLS